MREKAANIGFTLFEAVTENVFLPRARCCCCRFYIILLITFFSIVCGACVVRRVFVVLFVVSFVVFRILIFVVITNSYYHSACGLRCAYHCGLRKGFVRASYLAFCEASGPVSDLVSACFLHLGYRGDKLPFFQFFTVLPERFTQHPHPQFQVMAGPIHDVRIERFACNQYVPARYFTHTETILYIPINAKMPLIEHLEKETVFAVQGKALSTRHSTRGIFNVITSVSLFTIILRLGRQPL